MKICWLSDFAMEGSGYFNISAPLCNGLIAKGYELKAIGLGYKGEEHPYNFGIIPAPGMKEAMAILQNLYTMWQFDVFIVALDISIQEAILRHVSNRKFGYIGIMPIESDPLCMSWAMVLMQMDKVFIISQFGTEEAKKMGVQAEYLPVGVNLDAWVMPTEEEKKKLREEMGIKEDEFVVMTVADNQERKNLSRSMQIFAGFAKKVPNSRYILVTRENAFVGWKLRDLGQVFKINNKFNIYERGISFAELWNLYAISNAFLLTSKAEGLGMPLLESMAMGIPSLATNCTGMAELLGDGRGLLIDHEHQNHPELIYIDPFGNGHRYFADLKDGIKKLMAIFSGDNSEMIKKSREYIEQRDWVITLERLEKALQIAKGEDKNEGNNL